ncbi:hypothetical protein HYW46_02615 [Candidatus Daviesbacteria bacterium]|nr:hypothetical protein [Candidatus Daviesbacteria bacterium]
MFFNWKSGYEQSLKFSLRSNYKLPWSFIVFFVLMFFLLGEQLPALPTYLYGPGLGGEGPYKLHILDLALGDGLLHRPFAYLIIGTIIWILYRIFTWPLAWIIGATLWILEQRTLTPLDQRPTLINTIVFTFTFWILLTLVPYFIYRWVDQKWGWAGRRNAILIVLLINIFIFGFFAFQIYVLKNSYRGLHKNTGQQVVSSKVLPPNTCPERLITEKDKQTTIIFNGKTIPVSADEQKWIEQNCKEALQNP